MKIRNFGLCVAALLIGFSSTPSWAGKGYVELSGAPIYVKSDRLTGEGAFGGSATRTVNAASGLGYDFRGTLGYLFWDKMLVGFTYNTYRSPIKGEPVPNQAVGREVLEKNHSLGPSLGVIGGGFHLIGTYLLSGKRSLADKDLDDGSGSSTNEVYYEQKLGSGFQVNLGYTAPLSRVFSLGVSLVYQSASYKTGSHTSAADPTINYTDVTFTSKPVEAALTPLLSIVLVF